MEAEASRICYMGFWVSWVMYNGIIKSRNLILHRISFIVTALNEKKKKAFARTEELGDEL